jgi:membrane protein implicated in regulation of membrane protease activity
MRTLLLSFLTRLLPASASHFMKTFLTVFLQSFASQLFIWVALLLSAMLFLGLAGVALMLGLLQSQFHWVLVAVPALALLLVVGLWIRARQTSRSSQIQQRDVAIGFVF